MENTWNYLYVHTLLLFCKGLITQISDVFIIKCRILKGLLCRSFAWSNTIMFFWDWLTFTIILILLHNGFQSIVRIEMRRQTKASLPVCNTANRFMPCPSVYPNKMDKHWWILHIYPPSIYLIGSWIVSRKRRLFW